MEIQFAHAPEVDFGYCRWCKEKMESYRVELRLEGGGWVHVLKDVPQGRSPNCGSFAFKASALERIDAIYRAMQSG